MQTAIHTPAAQPTTPAVIQPVIEPVIEPTTQPSGQHTGIEQTKTIARAFFERFDANDVDGALALFSEDATYWLAGKPDELPGIGELSKPQIAKVFRRMNALLEDGLRMQVKSIIAEGDVAAVEVVSHGQLKNGRHYNNEYHIRIQVRDGLICSVREYYDSLHVHSVWYRQ